MILPLGFWLLSAPLQVALSHPYGLYTKRTIVTQSELLGSYDFVIAGGGTAGLVLASRLSEDANTTVLVIEAGDTGDAFASSINIPGNAYYQSLWNTPANWNFPTLAQLYAGNRTFQWPRGKVLGGSSAMNAMYSIRPSQIEVDTWPSLSAPGDNAAASRWGWSAMLAAMQKSETFVPPSPAIQHAAVIEYNSSSHGSNGPVYSTFPGYIVPLVGYWVPTLSALGIPESPDPYNGQTWGSFVAASTINPNNWTRSYSRSAYIDPLPPQSNLHILPNMMVTRVLFGNNLTASGVEYASNSTSARSSVGVNKEVILTGGAIGSPTILMQSGVGPQNILQAAGVQVALNLPGVGQHLQDHISAQLVFSTTADTATTLYPQLVNATSPLSQEFLSFVNSATGYINITSLLGSAASSFESDVANAFSNSSTLLGSGQDPTVIAGYDATYNVSQRLLDGPLGHIETLLSLMGPGQVVSIQAALQRPFSQGSLYITTNNPFDYPAIDPKYLSHPADIVLLRAGCKLIRQMSQTQPLAQVLTGEVTPGASVITDSDWDNWITGAILSQFHPSSTCAMLPLDQGGVVDTDLRVYGLANVRVADSSVFPMQFAAHLADLTYGLAEQAADFIRREYNIPTPAPTSSSTSSPTSSAQAKSEGSRGIFLPSFAFFAFIIGVELHLLIAL